MTNINQVWAQLVVDIMSNGETSAPRGIETKEFIGHQTTIDMSTAIITASQRGMNYRFMCGEAYWILSGSNRVAEITQFMKAIEKFSDDKIMFRGAYGPKVTEQLSYVVQNLFTDCDSRQAIINIWRENPGPSKDIPCTLSLQFLIRNNKLHCNATMRSSDIWLGWVYDTFNFSMISTWIAVLLRAKYPDLELGNLKLTAGSQHLYEMHFEPALKLIDGISYPTIEPIDLSCFVHPDDVTRQLYFAGLEEWEHVTSPFLLQIKDINNETR